MSNLLLEAGVAPGQKVLDIGFRDAAELQSIAALVGSSGSVLGIDIDSSHVENALRELNHVTNISIRRGSILEIPAPARSFDLILCKVILHEVRDLETAFSEISRVCKKNSSVSIIDFQKHSWLLFQIYRLISRMMGYCNNDIHPGFSREKLQNLLSRQQFADFSYRPLPEKWTLGFYKVNAFLLIARQVD